MQLAYVMICLECLWHREKYLSWVRFTCNKADMFYILHKKACCFAATLLDSRVSIHVNTVSSEPYLSPIRRDSCDITEISAFSTFNLVNFETFLPILNLNGHFKIYLSQIFRSSCVFTKSFSFIGKFEFVVWILNQNFQS